MFQKTLQFTSEILDQYLQTKFALQDSKVLLNRLVNLDGSLPEINSNKIIISFLNGEQETSQLYQPMPHKAADGQYSRTTTNVSYKFNALFTSNMDDYKESLQFLDSTVLFFQSNPIFDAQNYPNIPNGITKIHVNLENTNHEQMQNLWNSIGVPSQPALVYKIQLIHNDFEESHRAVTEVSSIKSEN